MSLKDKALDQAMCDELERLLKVEGLTIAQVQVAPRHNHYKWERRTRNQKAFRRALAKYSETHPDIDIFSEDIRKISPLLQYIIYLLAVAGSIASIMAVLGWS